MYTLNIRINTALLVFIALTGVVIVAMLATRARGGPLDPPGAPAPTQPSLIYQPASCSGFPIVVSVAGSYRLAANITGCSGKDGIQITSSNVSLDLAGFTLAGTDGSLEAMKSVGAISRLRITNGNIANWPIGGINVSGTEDARIDDVIVTDIAGDGISLGRSTAVDHVTVAHNTGYGIVAGMLQNNVTISNCNADYNGFGGIKVADAATIENCSIGNNAGSGIDAGRLAAIRGNHIHNSNGNGVLVADSCVVKDNVSEWNSNGHGFVVLAPGNCTIVGNKATANMYVGFFIDVNGGYSWVDGNHASGNGTYGFDIRAANPGYPNIVTRNAASANVSGNYSVGGNNDAAPIVAAGSVVNPMSNISN